MSIDEHEALRIFSEHAEFAIEEDIWRNEEDYANLWRDEMEAARIYYDDTVETALAAVYEKVFNEKPFSRQIKAGREFLAGDGLDIYEVEGGDTILEAVRTMGAVK